MRKFILSIELLHLIVVPSLLAAFFFPNAQALAEPFSSDIATATELIWQNGQFGNCLGAALKNASALERLGFEDVRIHIYYRPGGGRHAVASCRNIHSYNPDARTYLNWGSALYPLEEGIENELIYTRQELIRRIQQSRLDPTEVAPIQSANNSNLRPPPRSAASAARQARISAAREAAVPATLPSSSSFSGGTGIFAQRCKTLKYVGKAGKVAGPVLKVAGPVGQVGEVLDIVDKTHQMIETSGLERAVKTWEKGGGKGPRPHVTAGLLENNPKIMSSADRLAMVGIFVPEHIANSKTGKSLANCVVPPSTIIAKYNPVAKAIQDGHISNSPHWAITDAAGTGYNAVCYYGGRFWDKITDRRTWWSR